MGRQATHVSEPNSQLKKPGERGHTETHDRDTHKSIDPFPASEQNDKAHDRDGQTLQEEEAAHGDRPSRKPSQSSALLTSEAVFEVAATHIKVTYPAILTVSVDCA